MTANDKDSGRESSPDVKPTGDERIWDDKLEQALEAIDNGNNRKAGKILKRLRDEAPEERIRKAAAGHLKALSVDPWFYVVWGVSAAVLLAAFVYYVLIK